MQNDIPFTRLDESKRYKAVVRLLDGRDVRVYSTTNHADSSYGLQVWVDRDGNGYGQIGYRNPLYLVHAIEEIDEDEAAIFDGYASHREACARGGRSTSERKAAAVRANGAKGGRPQSDLSRAVDEAINILCREHPDRAEWPNLFRALTRRGLSLAGRAARIADILASLGWESDPRFGALFDALNRKPDEAD